MVEDIELRGSEIWQTPPGVGSAKLLAPFGHSYLWHTQF